MRSITSIALVVILTGCASSGPQVSGVGQEGGSICPKLRDLIRRDEKGFKETGVAGPAFESPQYNLRDYYLYSVTVTLPGMSKCFLSEEKVALSYQWHRDTKYICLVTDSTVSSDEEMRRQFMQLNATISACLVDSKWPGYRDEWGDSIRYHRSPDSYNFSSTFFDAKDQEINVMLAIVKGSGVHGNPDHLTSLDGFSPTAQSLAIEIERLKD